jgi:signal peptidase complex subunit 3
MFVYKIQFLFIFSKYMTEFGNAKKKNDLGLLNFDLETNLEPLFNWNVKQLFLYLTAEYETKNNV